MPLSEGESPLSREVATKVLSIQQERKRKILAANVRVRWVDHKCKVNSDEFDGEATLCSW
jgi:hypothetical protein